MGFFQDVHGGIYPISEIARIRHGKREPDGTRNEHGGIWLKGEQDPLIALTVEIDQIISGSLPTIPAASGHYILAYWGDSEPIEKMGIIGWRVSLSGALEPLVVDVGFEGMRGNNGILTPEGTVYDLDGATFSSQQAWEASMREQDTLRRAND